MSHVNEFIHEIRADRIGAASHSTEFEADERARGLLAKRFAILSIESLKGWANLTRQVDGLTIHVHGHFEADVTQACVTTLEPVPEHISEDFDAWFLDESQAASFVKAKKKREEADLPLIEEDLDERPMPDDHEDPEPVIGGVIDVGEVVAQNLSLALDPFPHSAAAEATGPIGDEKDLKPASPFEVLKDLISK